MTHFHGHQSFDPIMVQWILNAVPDCYVFDFQKMFKNATLTKIWLKRRCSWLNKLDNPMLWLNKWINICFRLLPPFDLWYILIYNHCMICLKMTVRDKLLPCTYWTCTPSSRVVDRWVPHLGRTRTRKLSIFFTG